jgi:hypothetical protein
MFQTAYASADSSSPDIGCGNSLRFELPLKNLPNGHRNRGDLEFDSNLFML